MIELRFECHIEVTRPVTAIDLLRAETAISGQRIKQAMVKGAAWFTRGKKTLRVRRAKRELRAGDKLHLYYDERVLALSPDAPELVGDEKGYSVWNKPYGMLSQGSKWGDHCTISRWAE